MVNRRSILKALGFSLGAVLTPRGAKALPIADLSCPECGESAPLHANYCSDCGARLDGNQIAKVEQIIQTQDVRHLELKEDAIVNVRCNHLGFLTQAIGRIGGWQMTGSQEPIMEQRLDGLVSYIPSPVHAVQTLKRRRGRKKFWSGRCQRGNHEVRVWRDNHEGHLAGLPEVCPGRKHNAKLG